MSENQETLSTDDFEQNISSTPEITGLSPIGGSAEYEFSNWEPNHLHWNDPSKFVFFISGEIVFFAKRLSNQRRTGVLDSGRTFYATIEFKFYKKADDPRPFYTYELPVARLGWKTRVDDYQKSWFLPGLIPYFTNSFSRVTRHWRADSNEVPPVVIPFPTIEF